MNREIDFKRMGLQRRNVYVGNLSVSATKDNLRVLFKQFGTIANIFIATPAADAKYTYGFVHFEKNEDALRAIEKLNGIYLHDRRLRIEPGSAQKDEIESFVSQMVVPKEKEDQVVTNQYHANDRGKYFTQLKNVYAEVCRSPVQPDTAQLLELSQLIEELNQLPLTSGPVYGQKKPKCSLDLDSLDDLSEKYYIERKQKSYREFVNN